MSTYFSILVMLLFVFLTRSLTSQKKTQLRQRLKEPPPRAATKAPAEKALLKPLKQASYGQRPISVSKEVPLKNPPKYIAKDMMIAREIIASPRAIRPWTPRSH